MNIFTESFWADEAFSALVMKLPFGKMIQILMGDVHPPFYYLLGSVWGKLFGFSEVSLRSLSFLFLIATTYVAYLISKSITNNKKLSILCGLAVFLIPFVNYNGFEARMYTLFTFFHWLQFTFSYKKSGNYIFFLPFSCFIHIISVRSL
jgi:uncharacterized membrane protein